MRLGWRWGSIKDWQPWIISRRGCWIPLGHDAFPGSAFLARGAVQFRGYGPATAGAGKWRISIWRKKSKKPPEAVLAAPGAVVNLTEQQIESLAGLYWRKAKTTSL